MRHLSLFAVVAVVVSVALLTGEAQAGADEASYPFPNLETHLDRMTSGERKATRSGAMDVAIKRAVDEPLGAPQGVEDGDRDAWIAPLEADPRRVLCVYGRMRAASHSTVSHRGFESRPEEALASAKVAACLMYLLGEERYPGVRMEAARGLGLFGAPEVGERRAAEIRSRLLSVVRNDPSPMVRLRAATSLIWLDEESAADERIYRPLLRIVLDDGELGWILENTNISTSDLACRGLSGGEGLACVKQDSRTRALELLIPAIERLSDSERARLRRAAIDLRCTAFAAPARAYRVDVMVERVDRFVSAVDQLDREEWYSRRDRRRTIRHGRASSDADLR